MPEISFTVRVVNSDDDPMEGFKVIVCSTSWTRPHKMSEHTDEDGRADFIIETGFDDHDTVDIWLKVYTIPIILHSETLEMGQYKVEDGDEITLMVPDDHYESTDPF